MTQRRIIQSRPAFLRGEKIKLSQTLSGLQLAF